jgi:Domain of unknown function (DUF4417)
MMLLNQTSEPHDPIDSISKLTWLPECEFDGIEQIPVLAPRSQKFEFPESLIAFDRIECSTGRASALLHFFVADSRLSQLVRQPLRYIPSLADYKAVTTPDFSVYRNMPPHRRVLSTALNRSFGVLFQSRGLDVIPTIRWSGADDYRFAFAGVPIGSPIAVSNHGCWRSMEDKKIFEAGLISAVDFLQPKSVIVHGRTPRRQIIEELARQGVATQIYPSRIEAVHQSESTDGRR